MNGMLTFLIKLKLLFFSKQNTTQTNLLFGIFSSRG